MQPAESSQSHWRILCAILVFFASQNLTALCYGQARDRHLQQFADLPPGQVGQMQLSRGGPLAGYFQPVRMTVPKGAQVSLWAEDHFEAFEANQADAGMLVSGVYRTRVTRIPGQAGFEVYPTIEIINRLFPPQGQEQKYPIPVVITQEILSGPSKDNSLSEWFISKIHCWHSQYGNARENSVLSMLDLARTLWSLPINWAARWLLFGSVREFPLRC